MGVKDFTWRFCPDTARDQGLSRSLGPGGLLCKVPSGLSTSQLWSVLSGPGE